MAKKLGKKDDEEEEPETQEEEKVCPVGKVTEKVAELNARGTSGVLSSPALSADIHIHNFTMSFHGKVSILPPFRSFIPLFRFCVKTQTSNSTTETDTVFSEPTDVEKRRC